MSFSKRSAGFEVFFRKGGTQKHMHIRAGGWKTKNAKIVSNFLSRPVPLRLRRNVWKQGSVHVDVYARLAVLSHRCHKQRWWMGTVLRTEEICFAPTGFVCKCRARAGFLRTETRVKTSVVQPRFEVRVHPVDCRIAAKPWCDPCLGLQSPRAPHLRKCRVGLAPVCDRQAQVGARHFFWDWPWCRWWAKIICKKIKRNRDST